MSESSGLEGEDNVLLAVFHGPTVPSGPYFSAVLSGWLLLATLSQESAWYKQEIAATPSNQY